MIKNKIQSINVYIAQHRELIIFSLIYFFLSLVSLIQKIRMTPTWTNGDLVRNHSLLMNFQYYNNEQSRVMQYLIPELFSRIFSLETPNNYAFARLIFVFLAFLVFHFFLRKWFTSSESFAGVLILWGSMSVSFMLYDLQESAPLMMLMFILCLWAIREKKDLLFTVALWFGGGLVNETMLILPAAYYFFRLNSIQPKHIFKTTLKTVIIALPAFITQATLRYMTRSRPHLGGAYHFPGNWSGILADISKPITQFYSSDYLLPFFIFSIFWIFALFGYKKSPLFLKRVFWITPFFIVAHLITGIIKESRQMIPLGFIIIPMALFFIFRPHNSNPKNGEYEKP